MTEMIWILVIYILPAAEDSKYVIENYVNTVIQLFIPAVYSDYLYLCCDSSTLLYHLEKWNFHAKSKDIQISKTDVKLYILIVWNSWYKLVRILDSDADTGFSDPHHRLCIVADIYVLYVSSHCAVL